MTGAEQARRLDVEFPVDGGTCRAWLYLPAGSHAVPPVVVMAHGLGGTRRMRLDAFAERFCSAGYACLVFDYRSFGDSPGEPRGVIVVRDQLADWARAVAYARTRPEVDPDRVVLWGTSFSGGHVIVTGARDERVAAVIAQCPFTDGIAAARAMSPAASARCTARAVLDIAGHRLGRPPLMIDTAGRPGTTAILATPDALLGFDAILPEDADTARRVAARIGLTAAFYVPGRHARHLRQPALFLVCELDSVTPAARTLHWARQAPAGTVRTYPYGHFDIYVGDGFDRVVADQLGFLRAHVPVVAAARGEAH